MPKMKTKSGAKKRFKMTASGRVKAKSYIRRHHTRTPQEGHQSR